MEEVDKGWLMMGVSGRMGECFIRYQPTWVVLDKGPLNGCVWDFNHHLLDASAQTLGQKTRPFKEKTKVVVVVAAAA